MTSPLKYPRLMIGHLYVLNILYAISTTILGPLMPTIIAEYNISLAQGGLFASMKGIGGILSILLGIMVSDRIAKSHLLTLSFVIVGLMLFLIGYVNVYLLLLLVFFVLGAGCKLADTILSAFTADILPRRRSFYLNMLHTFYGFGACFSPFYVQILLARDWSWNKTFSLLGIITIGLTVLVPFLAQPKHKNDFKQMQDNQETERADLKVWAFVQKEPRFFYSCLIMFFYIGHHAILSNWIPLYIEEHLKASSSIAGFGITSLWIGMTLGRLSCAYLVEKLKPLPILIGGSLLGAFVLAVGFLWPNTAVLLVALFLSGLLTGNAVPLLIAVLCDQHPESSGTISSLIFLSGALSGIFFSWFSGLIAETIGFTVAMLLTCVLLLAMTVLSSMLKRGTARALPKRA